jgi:hypothetical protein
LQVGLNGWADFHVQTVLLHFQSSRASLLVLPLERKVSPDIS